MSELDYNVDNTTQDMYADFLDFCTMGDYPNAQASADNMRDWNETLANKMFEIIGNLRVHELNWTL